MAPCPVSPGPLPRSAIESRTIAWWLLPATAGAPYSPHPKTRSCSTFVVLGFAGDAGGPGSCGAVVGSGCVRLRGLPRNLWCGDAAEEAKKGGSAVRPRRRRDPQAVKSPTWSGGCPACGWSSVDAAACSPPGAGGMPLARISLTCCWQHDSQRRAGACGAVRRTANPVSCRMAGAFRASPDRCGAVPALTRTAGDSRRSAGRGGRRGRHCPCGRACLCGGSGWARIRDRGGDLLVLAGAWAVRRRSGTRG
jgi:hypothetical protein